MRLAAADLVGLDLKTYSGAPYPLLTEVASQAVVCKSMAMALR